MFLSILVPVYNVENYIRTCLNCLISQTFTDFEIILIDDGSTDSSGAICDEFAKRDKRIKVVHKINEGIVKTRKLALSMSKGEYIGIVDSDDSIEPTMYKRLCETATKYNADVVVCGSRFNYGDHIEERDGSDFEGLYNKEELKNKIYPQMLSKGEFFHFGISPTLWNKIYRRDLIMDYMLIHDDVIMGEDAAAVYPCILNANSVYFISNEYLYNYRISHNSITREYKKWHFTSNRNLFKRLYEVMNTNILIPQLYDYIIYMSFSALLNEFSNKNERTFLEKMAGVIMYLTDDIVREALINVDVHRLPFHLRVTNFLMKDKSYITLSLLISIFVMILNRKEKIRQKKLKNNL